MKVFKYKIVSKSIISFLFLKGPTLLVPTRETTVDHWYRMSTKIILVFYGGESEEELAEGPWTDYSKNATLLISKYKTCDISIRCLVLKK